MSNIILPAGYKPALNLYDTQMAIGTVKRLFADTLCATLNLRRVSAPLFVEASTGLNDDLNGVERKVSFDMKDTGVTAEVVQSLAKWKRKALKDYDFHVGKGLYCDMNAIRRDEELDNLHSVYVDQWDWEKVIREEDRNLDYLKNVVRAIVSAVCATEMNLHAMFPQLERLPLHTPNVTFITTQELEDLYPALTPKERENAFVKEHGTTFLMQIGRKLRSGKPHDGRAPDYDDWDLNGDLLFWNDPLERSYELSSMGIRVSPESLDRQLREAHDYARSKGVAIKGDIPIGVSRTGVDVWMSPRLFDTGSSAGAPPDDFSTTGQNWGFPIYDWEEMSRDGYAWWRARLAKMSEYFDAYRIDHILGFFRIWEVPLGAVNALLGEFNPSSPYSEQDILSYGFAFDRNRDTAVDYSSDDVLWLEYRHGRGGFYCPRITPFATECFARLPEEQKRAFERIHNDFYYCRHNEMWRSVGRLRLSALVGSAPMLACGEDLGMIPDCVPEVMREEQILSLEIERMPKAMGCEFSDVSGYPYLSVCTTSSPPVG